MAINPITPIIEHPVPEPVPELRRLWREAVEAARRSHLVAAETGAELAAIKRKLDGKARAASEAAQDAEMAFNTALRRAEMVLPPGWTYDIHGEGKPKLSGECAPPKPSELPRKE